MSTLAKMAVVTLLGSVIVPGAFAAPPAGVARNNDVQVVRSSSGQFVVSSSRSALARRPATGFSTNASVVDLDSDVLAVSCERVKQMLLRELGVADVWRGRVYVAVNSDLTNNSPAVIVARPFTDGWHYRMDVPLQMDRAKLVRGLVQVLLMEIANRTAGLRSAEIPLWLTEGLTQHLMRVSERDLILSEPRWNVNRVNINWVARQALRRDPLKEVRERFDTHTALTFGKLSEALPEPLPEETWKTYQASAQLFVHQLLMLQGGRAELVEMLLELPHYLNWQAAFLNAFRPHFVRMLDVEKWWAVVLVHFTGLDPAQAWKPDVALRKLDEILRPALLVSVGPKKLPRRTQLSLQQIVGDRDYLRQRIILRTVVSQLIALRVRTPRELVWLVDEYRKALEDYLNKHDQAGVARALPGLPPTRADLLARDLEKRLNELDGRRTEAASAAGADGNAATGLSAQRAL